MYHLNKGYHLALLEGGFYKYFDGSPDEDAIDHVSETDLECESDPFVDVSSPMPQLSVVGVPGMEEDSGDEVSGFRIPSPLVLRLELLSGARECDQGRRRVPPRGEGNGDSQLMKSHSCVTSRSSLRGATGQTPVAAVETKTATEPFLESDTTLKNS